MCIEGSLYCKLGFNDKPTIFKHVHLEFKWKVYCKPPPCMKTNNVQRLQMAKLMCKKRRRDLLKAAVLTPIMQKTSDTFIFDYRVWMDEWIENVEISLSTDWVFDVGFQWCDGLVTLHSQTHKLEKLKMGIVWILFWISNLFS